MTSQTSSACYFLSPLYQAYLQLIALAVCKGFSVASLVAHPEMARRVL